MVDKPKKVVIKVNDKRVASESSSGPREMSNAEVASGSSSGPREMSDAGSDHVTGPTSGSGASDISLKGQTDDPEARATGYLDDLKRLQAEFDNYRKRVMRDNAAVGDRAAARVIESLLPVLDNFERAISHGEGGEGVELVFKELKATLEREGLEEVPAIGVAFDPNVHEAVESRETEGLEEPSIIEVYRRGYLHKGQLIRPAMVVVGRPIENEQATE